MSVDTLPRTTNGGDDFTDLEFAALVADLEPFNPADLFAGAPLREHRPARTNARRAAIEQSMREEV
jgi:hypothetical protein